MVPLDADHDPTTTASSSATWELPEGGRVRWAGLHFSGAGDADAPEARVWEGDAGLGGDRVTVAGAVTALTGGRGEADNAFTGSARGAQGNPHAFGTDVVRSDPVLGRETDIRIHSEQDAVVVGVVVLTAPMRT